MRSKERASPQLRGEKVPDEKAWAEFGQRAGGLLHDLGGMVSIVLGRVTLAEREARRTERPRGDLAELRDDLEEIRRMTSEALTDLKGQAEATDTGFEVVSVAEDAVSRWTTEGPLLEISILNRCERRWQARGPESFLTRALVNLLRNAGRYAERRVTVRLTEESDSVVIAVEDDGPGVPERIQEQLFTPFARNSERDGFGLGLASARKLVNRLGGALTFEGNAEVLGGACFTIRLPATPVANTSTREERLRRGRFDPSASPPSSCNLDGVRILLVEDEEVARKAWSRLLEMEGAEAVAVDPTEWQSPEESARIIEEAGADVVLMDVDLGIVSGLDVHEAMREKGSPVTPNVLFVTGDINAEFDTEQPVFSKVDGRAEILEAIQETVGRA